MHWPSCFGYCFSFGVITCVTLLQVVLFLQFWCCCSCDTQTILVVVLIWVWVLFFLSNALVFPPSFNVGVVVDATILLFIVIVSILVLTFVQCSCCFVHCSDFWCWFVCDAVAFLFQFWCCCLQYVIPDLVIVSIEVSFWNTLDVLVIVFGMLLLL